MNSIDKHCVRPIHYLGSKLRMLDSIKTTIDAIDLSGGTVCDLFSGSGTVSEYLVNYRDVFSVDIQHYSQILCEATARKLDKHDDVQSIVKQILKTSEYQVLNNVFMPLLSYEQSGINQLLLGNLDFIYEIIESGSIYIYMHEPISNRKMSAQLSSCLSETKMSMQNEGIADSELTMITRYYGGIYFSYKQAVDVDAIAAYVFKQEGLLQKKLLAALLSTTSEIVNTVGKQFAQPLKVRDSSGKYKQSLKKKILLDRTIDVFSVFSEWINFYLNSGTDAHTLTAVCEDYVDGIGLLENHNVKVVYADPPYTRYHYSRYYHVLESICLRDNPEVNTTFPNGKGGISRAIYRAGRHQSPFCVKTQAEGAFVKMFEGISNVGIPIVLSYSPFDAGKPVTPRLRTIEQLVNLASQYYHSVEVISPGEFTHSKLNSVDKNFETNHEAERLIICR